MSDNTHASRWDSFITTLNTIENVALQSTTGLAPESNTILFVTDLFEFSACANTSAEVTHYLCGLGFNTGAAVALDDLLDTAAYLGQELLINGEGSLNASAVKKLKAEGFGVDSISSLNSPVKAYVAIVTAVGTIVIHVDAKGVRAVDKALEWREERVKESPAPWWAKVLRCFS